MKVLGIYASTAAAVLLCLASFADKVDTSRARDVFCAAILQLRKTPAEQLPKQLDEFLSQQLDIPQHVPLAQAQERRRQVLIGVAALFDGHATLASNIVTRDTFANIARPEEKALQRQIGDRLEFAGRNDAGLHFFLSIGLTADLGPFLAERLGRAKEIQDAQRLDAAPAPGQQGYSFVDLAYDIAGIEYARRLLDAQRLPDDAGWAAPPSLSEFLAPLATLDLPEGLGWKRFQAEYTGENHAKFEALVRKIRTAVGAPTQP
ncbi:MAG: hypothetical protein AAF581_14965 [Planctomycetota bacterium]